MLSYQIYHNGTWFHCDDRADYYNHQGDRRAIFLSPDAFRELIATGDLKVK